MIVIYGAGGFGREVLCLALDAGFKQILFMVDDQHYNASEIMGFKVIKRSEFHPSFGWGVVVAVGDPAKRKAIVESLPEGTVFKTLIHPSVIMSDWVEIGEGSVITAGVILTCNIKLGKHTHLNLHTTIGHDCIAGDYFTTAPAANISGNCTFGNYVYFGTNSDVKEGVNIVDNVTIGMGAVVINSIDEQGVYVGNPVRKL